jgi:hypothetical protein
MVFAHDGKGVESGVRGSIVLIRRICENPQLSKIMNSIQVKNITSIRIVEPPDHVINFGSKGECGVIIMTCNKKLNKKIKKVL